MKNYQFLTTILLFLIITNLTAQVPSYVPTDGLVAYYPFNGNANDETGNGNNGTVNGAILTEDRFGAVSSAYDFDGVDDKIFNSNEFLTLNVDLTISVWLNTNDITQGNQTIINSLEHTGIGLNFNHNYNSGKMNLFLGDGINFWDVNGLGGIKSDYQNETWYNIILIKQNDLYKVYVNGVVDMETNVNNASNYNNIVGFAFGTATWKEEGAEYFNGKLDDIGIWNRALTEQEVANLYTSNSSNECSTLVINTGVLSTNPVTYSSTVNIYPNPANDQITIDCGNLDNVEGWNIKITNMLGQEVFSQPMNTQQYVIPLNTWTGQGMYFVKIINAQNEVVNIKKIVLQ